MSTAAGWYHAEGDPPNQIRYWNGTAWTGEPVAAPTAETPSAQAAASGNWFVRLVSPTGRVNRQTYFLTELAVAVLYTFGGIALIAIALGGLETPAIALLFIFIYVLMPFALWLFIATTSKRLHDQGSSAMWLLVILVPFGGPILNLICLVAPGNAGPNVHGSDPGPGFHL